MPITGRPLGMLVDLDDTIVSDSVRAAENWRDAVTSVVPDTLAAALLLAAIHEQRAWYWSDPERHRVGRADLIAARRTIVAAAVEQAASGNDRDLIEAIVGAYTERTESDRRLLPGAIEAIEELRAMGLPLALVTNGAETAQRGKIERFGLGRLFDVIVIEGSFGAGKPDPSVYRHALAGLAVAADDAWMVGDHLEWDVAAPQRLGLVGVWLDIVGEGLPDGAPARPDLIVRDLPALASIIRALPGSATRTS